MYDFERFFRVKVDRVIDGDTLRVSFYLGLGIWLNDQPVRLLGINAPEIKGESKDKGIAVKKFLELLMRDAEDIIIRTDEEKKGKYGRFLVTVMALKDGKWHNVNELLLERGAVREYAASDVSTEDIFNVPEKDLEKRLDVDEKRTETEVYQPADTGEVQFASEILQIAKELL